MRTLTCRVAEIPELVGLICAFIEKPDLVELLTVSQRFFYCAAPLIWRDMDGVERLLNLLPNLDSGGHLQTCNQAQLARFNTYASFVQNLETYTDSEVTPSWAILLERVLTRPLLPNLRTLVIPLHKYKQHNLQITRYVEQLLCPTLSDIRMGWGCYNLWINPAHATHLLAQMASKSPNLTRLQILVGNSQYPDDLRSLGTFSRTALLSFISKFRNLCVLSTSTTVLDSGALQVLGCLPHLESLMTHSVPAQYMKPDEIPVADLSLPKDSFPALRHLGINSVPGTVVSKLWQTAPLVQNLVSVAVKFMNSSTKSLNDLICDICRGSLLVIDLDLDLVEARDVELSATVVDHFRQLPLRRVRIQAGYTDYQYLVPALPNVEYLEMEAMLVYFEDLVLISKCMPKLQYLSGTMILWPWPIHLPHNSTSPSLCHIDSQFAFEEDFGLDRPYVDNYVEHIAQTLHSLWPKGVRCGYCSSLNWFQGDSDSDFLEIINDTTEELSGTSALNIPTVEESKSRWMYASW